MANLPKGGCVTQVSIIWDVWDPLGLHLNQKDLKTGKKWLSNGQFTKGRLCDSSEYHMGCMRSIGALFEPKSYEIGPEMAEFWPIYQWEVVWFKWVSHGMYEIYWGFIWTKKLWNRARNGRVMANLPKRGCVTQVSTTLDLWDPLGLHLNQKAIKLGQKWPSYGQHTNGRLCDSSKYHCCMG